MRNQTRGTVLGEAIELADTSAKRRTGLLQHDRLEAGTGLWIVPCESVHTFFMKFAIDLVYVDRKNKVRKVMVCISVRKTAETDQGPADPSDSVLKRLDGFRFPLF